MKNYNEFKNYIHNELNITKEDIQDMIRKIIQEEIQKMFNDETKIQSLLERMVRNTINKQYPQGIFYHTLISFNDMIEEHTLKAIYSEIKNRLKIELLPDTKDINEKEIKK